MDEILHAEHWVTILQSINHWENLHYIAHFTQFCILNIVACLVNRGLKEID